MPVKRRKRQAVAAAFSILLILFLDQYSKTLVCSKLTIGESIPIIRDILHLTYVKNTGAAFGLFKDNNIIFILISLVAVLFILSLIVKSISKGEISSKLLFNSGLILILSGAIGNLIDRVKFGYVIDFIDVRIWPVFNIADSSITIGTALLLVSFLSSTKRQLT